MTSSQKDDIRVPFALPDIQDGEVEEVVAALRSGWITTGPRTHEFERRFARFVGSPHAVAVNSATAGLHLCLEVAGVGPGDAVIVPTVTFASSALVALHCGAEPVLADIDEETGLATAETMQAAAARAREMGLRPAVFMPVHLAGQACDMDAIRRAAAQYQARIVEDAAHALPTTYQGRLVGSISEYTVFSFYATKTIATGEGGMITVRDETTARRLKTLRLHGISTDVWDRYRSDRPKWYYEVVAAGYKYNMPDLAAALGLRQLARCEEMARRRKEIAEIYAEEWRDLPIQPLGIRRPEDRHAWHLYIVRLVGAGPAERQAFIEQLAEQGVGASVHFIPLHRMPVFRDRPGMSREFFPGAEAYHANCVSLPLFSAMSERDVEYVVRAVRRAVTSL
ncbi:MAG: DegT/DnrJ/EryC1/StrS family aminotransferase [Planctomycetota bacterium]|nr:MAG: DegT/DnrJ/EryC1/StrS family aminotransferase [Planctomycetota bacterium]